MVSPRLFSHERTKKGWPRGPSFHIHCLLGIFLLGEGDFDFSDVNGVIRSVFNLEALVVSAGKVVGRTCLVGGGFDCGRAASESQVVRIPGLSVSHGQLDGLDLLREIGMCLDVAGARLHLDAVAEVSHIHDVEVDSAQVYGRLCGRI